LKPKRLNICQKQHEQALASALPLMSVLAREFVHALETTLNLFHHSSLIIQHSPQALFYLAPPYGAQ
jgi:hypothetical protein